MKHIKLIEGYDTLSISELEQPQTITRQQAEELANYMTEQDLNEQYIIWGSSSVLFINYVGFIQCSDFCIELLPKVNVGKEDCSREVLYRMLNEVGYLEMDVTSNAYVANTEDHLLEIFAAHFARTLMDELHRGVTTRYIQVERNLSTLKGSLLTNEHIRENVVRNKRYQAYCEYEERTVDHTLNQTFKTVTLQLIKVVSHMQTQMDLQKILHVLDDVSDKWISFNEAQSIALDRTNSRFEIPLQLAKLFLQRNVSTFSHDEHVSFSILFEMNDLFEKYIAQLIPFATLHRVYEQHKGHRLLVNDYTNRGIFQLQPDIVIEQDDCQLVIDTKWKRLKNSNRKGVQREDLYQMYAYVTRYKKAKAAILLYPYTDEVKAELFPIESWTIEGQPSKKVAVHMVSLHDRAETIKQLSKIVAHHLGHLDTRI